MDRRKVLSLGVFTALGAFATDLRSRASRSRRWC